MDSSPDNWWSVNKPESPVDWCKYLFSINVAPIGDPVAANTIEKQSRPVPRLLSQVRVLDAIDARVEKSGGKSRK